MGNCDTKQEIVNEYHRDFKECKMNLILRNSLIAFFLTVVFGLLYNLTVSPNDSMAFAWSLIILPVFGAFNSGFLLIVYFTRLSGSILINLKYIVLEIIIFFLTYTGISSLLDKIPYKYRFEILPESTVIKFYLTYPFDFIYTFALLTILILLVRKRLSANKEPDMKTNN